MNPFINSFFKYNNDGNYYIKLKMDLTALLLDIKIHWASQHADFWKWWVIHDDQFYNYAHSDSGIHWFVRHFTQRMEYHNRIEYTLCGNPASFGWPSCYLF